MLQHQFNNYLILLVCLCFTLCGCVVNKTPHAIPAQLRKVVSGQTIEVMIDNEIYRVRLSGLDTPSVKLEFWAQEAQQQLIKLLTDNYQKTLNQVTVLLETNWEQKDSYGRLNGYVWLENKLINQQIIQQGYAMANLTYTEGKYDQQLILAQDYARIMGKGIWNLSQPLRNLTMDDSPETIMNN